MMDTAVCFMNVNDEFEWKKVSKSTTPLTQILLYIIAVFERRVVIGSSYDKIFDVKIACAFTP